MAERASAGPIRITVELPEQTAEFSVPPGTTVADLLPTVLRIAGKDTVESGVEHGGWTLFDAAASPLDHEGTVDGRDGAVLRLRPRADARPEPPYDDLVDGIAASMDTLGHHWSDHAARRVLRWSAVVFTAALFVLLLLSVPATDTGRAGALTVAGTAAVLALAGGLAASRAAGDPSTAVVLGVTAVAFCALAGWLVPPDPDVWRPSAERLLPGAAGVVGGAVVVMVVVGVRPMLFAALVLLGAAAALAGALVELVGLSSGRAAATVALVALGPGAFAARLAVQLAGLWPAPRPGGEGRAADDWRVAVLAGARSVLAAACLVLVVVGDAPGLALAAGLALLLFLQSTAPGGPPERLTALVPAAAVAVALILATALPASQTVRFAVAGGCVALGLAMIAFAAAWGRTKRAGAVTRRLAVVRDAVVRGRASPWGRVAGAVVLLFLAARVLDVRGLFS
ncbi:EsaB/YukD family protein [Streptomyces sp. NPDC035033]|uniref:EsaB/YukD family protein n=1 Tax=Streptomyces sp. NPDC035033 TaxID=3155368 RepID=UPI003410BA46